jgi:hypothetical protein
MVRQKGIGFFLALVYSPAKGQRVEDNARTEVELYYNFDDSEVLIRKCKLLACEKDVAPLYPDDPSFSPVKLL